MARIFEHTVAALVALIIVSASFTAVVTVPPAHALAAAAPALA